MSGILTDLGPLPANPTESELARRAVHRIVGDDCADILAALGLDGAPDRKPARRTRERTS